MKSYRQKRDEIRKRRVRAMRREAFWERLKPEVQEGIRKIVKQIKHERKNTT